ncbi:MAG: murein hydrolase activator EnvC family protein [Lachnospiraceae bacterium]
MRIWNRFIQKTAFILALLLLFTAPTSILAESLNDMQEEKEQLESALESAQELVDTLEDSQTEIETKVEQLDTELSGITAEIGDLEAQLLQKEEAIAQKKEGLTAAQEDVEQQYESMKLRIKYMYENSNTSMLEMLVTSTSLTEFLSSVEYVRQLASYDRSMLERYQLTCQQIETAKAELEAEQRELVSLQQKYEGDQQAVTLLLDAKQSELQEVEENLSDASELTEVYQAEIDAQNEIIEQIRQAEEAKKAAKEAERLAAEEAARKAAEEAAKKAEEEAAQKAEEEAQGTETEGTESTESDSETQEPESEEPKTQEPVIVEDDKYNGGTFAWPVPSSTRVTSDYGARPAPTAGASTFHKGIDIGAAGGADIVAAADGTVIFAGYSSGAGNYLMVDHGGSVYTVYMHCSSIVVANGTKVTRGQVIAKVGSTGISTGNHLHFGVSQDGSYVSPWSYLGR